MSHRRNCHPAGSQSRRRNNHCPGVCIERFFVRHRGPAPGPCHGQERRSACDCPRSRYAVTEAAVSSPAQHSKTSATQTLFLLGSGSCTRSGSRPRRRLTPSKQKPAAQYKTELKVLPAPTPAPETRPAPASRALDDKNLCIFTGSVAVISRSLSCLAPSGPRSVRMCVGTG